MKNKLFIIITLVAIVFFMATCKSSNKQNTNTTVLKLGWIYSGSYAPEAIGIKEFAKKNNINIKLEPGGPGKDPLKLVGDNEFGVTASDEILRAIDKGAPYVIIGLINNNSPTVFLSLEQDSIKTPKDFEGKTIGILPFGSTGLIYKIMVKKNKVDMSKVREVTVYPDLKVFIQAKTHQVQPAFIYDEPITLDLQGVKYNIIDPNRFGVSFRGPCYFTTLKTIEQNPQLVQAFINTMAAGIETAIQNPDKALQALKEIAPSIDEKRELMVWKRGLDYYRGYNNKPLSSDISTWDEMLAEMKAFGEVKSNINLNNALNFSFVNNYYKK